MSASDKLNEALFHGKSHRFKPGDLILPPEQSGKRSEWEHVSGNVTKNAFATPNISDAMHFAKSSFIFKRTQYSKEGIPRINRMARPRVYEVEPLNPESLKTRTSSYADNDSVYKYTDVKSPEGFRVVRRAWIGDQSK